TTDTTTATAPNTTAPGGERDGGTTRDSGPQQGPLPLSQTRARAIRRIGGTVERVNTHFDTGSRGMRGLLEETFRTFSETRSGLHDGYRRKLESFLSRASGNGLRFENHSSAEELAASKSAATSWGSRMRLEMSGGLWSPHDIRATIATKVEADEVTDMRPVEAQMRWGGSSETTLSTTTSLTRSVGLRFGGSGGRNPNPHPSDGSLPNEAERPIPLVGPSHTRTFFSRSTSNTRATAFTSSVLFIPNDTKTYAFRASGKLTQAIEFLKNWSIGPTLTWKTLYLGWTAPVKDLLAGYVHSRDAHQDKLVQDRAVRDGDKVHLGAQPNPKKPDNARVRPGFEDNGRQLHPADPGAALQNLVDDLASNGLELTKQSRENLLQKLTTHLGQNPDSTVPVPVEVHALGSESGPDSKPRAQHWSTEAKVFVNLTRDPKPAEVSYPGQSGYYIESHKWTQTQAGSQTRGTGNSSSLDGVLLQPTSYPQDEQGPDQQPGHRPLFASPAGALSSSTNDSRTSGESRDDTHTVELHLDTPFAKVRADTTMTLTLELGAPKGGRNGNPSRAVYTGEADSGQVDTLYAFAYMDFDPQAETTTDTVTEGDTRGTGADLLSPPPAPTVTTSTDGAESTGTDRDTPPAPEGDDTTGDRTRNDTTGDGRAATPPSNDGATQLPVVPKDASAPDLLRAWADNAGPRPGNDSALALPAMVENDGQALRDQANIVFARSLGWKPSTDTPAEGQPTSTTTKAESTSTTTKAERTSAEAKAARAYLAAEYGQDPVYNDIDHSFSKGAIKAVVQSASREQEGVQFADLNRTQWGAKALTSTRGAKILDALPGGQLSDSRTRSRTHSAGTSHGGSRGRGAEMRPSALSTEVDGIRYEGHEGNYTGTAGLNTSSSNGSGSGSNQAVKGYQESDQLRQGPVYLIEHDTTWAFAAGSKLKTPAAFHSEDPSLLSTSPSSRPTRWAMGQVTIRTAEWYSESDAIAMGFLTPDQAKDTAPVVKQLAKTRKEFTEAEAAYADTRAPLEGLAERYAAKPADERAESAYNAQEKKYEDALKAFNKQIDALGAATNTVRTTFGGVGQGTDGGTAPPARTPSGDGNGETTRAPAPADNTTANGTTGTPATGSTDNTGVTSGTTTSTGNTGDVTTTTGGPLPSIIVTPPAPEPAPTEPAPTEPAPTEPRQNLVDHFRTALNLEVPKSDSPVQDTEGGLEQNTDTIDAQVQRASDAADTAAQAARDARVAVNGLSTTLDRGRADLQDGNRFLEGSGGEVPAAGTEGRSPAPGADGAPAPGAVRQAQDAQQAADTAHDNATTADRDVTATRNNATATAPVRDQRALLGQLRTAVSEAEGTVTPAADAQRTAERHAQTVTGLGNELDGARTRHQELSTAVEGLSGQDRAAGGDRAAQDAR
ncbi:hypothetical protein Q7689_10215, partial [Nocardiopsis tropica]|nr:hypothetical protein [Nocardiopsis tropica]